MAKSSVVKSKRKLLNPIFHLQTPKEDDNQLSEGMIKIVQRTGQLNLSGRGLAFVPDKMFTMYDIKQTTENYDFGKTNDEDSWWQFKPLTYLDLSSNVLQEIPAKIGNYEDLTVLNLQDNSITSLPVEIGQLTKLTKLNLSHNKITRLPKEFYRLTELETLSLAYNCLEDLSKSFADLIMLRHLDLSHNNLTNLPSGIGFLVRLNEFNLSNNKLTELPPDIVNLRALVKLDLTHNDLTCLPSMNELKKLQFLYAQHNNITEIPDFDECTHLEEIYFGNNFIKEVSKEFCENMSNLKILDLRDNQIEELPNEIAILQHLIKLDLTNNSLTSLPNSLGLLAHLQNLQVEGNTLRQIRSDVIKGGTLRILKYLREKLDSEELEKLQKPLVTHNLACEPKLFPDKYSMKNSRGLNLAIKHLTQIPEDVFQEAKLAEVGVVDLCKNKLTHVPNMEVLVEELTEINLSFNLIQSIPDYFSKCSKLGYLDLSNNALQTLPDCLKSLNRLRELVISNNHFQTIPECVYEMINLEILLASDNKITEINVEGLSRLKKIARLDLSNNNIAKVPPELGNLKQLRSLEIRGNSFKQPRYAILEQGTETILSYLRDRIPQ